MYRERTLLTASALLILNTTGVFAASEQAQEIARSSILVDTHIDVPYRLQHHWADVTGATDDGDYDYPRAREGRLDTIFMSIYTPAEIDKNEGGHWQLANELIDSVEALVYRAPDKYMIVTNPGEARAAFAAGKIGFAMGMENGSPIGDDLANLQHFHDRGIRYITLAHSKANLISDSSYDPNRMNKGLSAFGREVVAEMNRLGIMIDISHLTDDAALQALELSTVPVIASHSSARALTPEWERNMSDALIQAMAAKGGVIGINFGSSFLTEEANTFSRNFYDLRGRQEMAHGHETGAVAAWEKQYRADNPYPYADLSDVLDHIDHVVKLVGIDHVGLGSDYDGVGDSLPTGLKSVAEYPNLVDGMLERGYSEADIKKVLGENFLRVWQQVEDGAD